MGANKVDVCTRGHHMDITRKFHPNGDSYCFECKKIRSTNARKNNPAQAAIYGKRSSLRKAYGLEESDYNALFDSQDGKCAICSRQLERISRSTHIDHCHSTKKVRGILCHNCNTAIGLLGDSISNLTSAIKYIERSKNG